MAEMDRIVEIARKKVDERRVPSKYKESTIELISSMMSHDAYGNADYKWSLNDFELGHRLGRGKFGRVYSARERKTHYVVALKTIKKQEVVNGGVERQILREIEIQTHLKHPNILQLLTWFQDEFRIYLVLEYAGQGELYNHLKNSPDGRFPEERSAKYVYQVADALEYCHKNHVIHRDLKPENILLTYEDNVKISDFGWSVHAPSLRRNTMCGTLDYLPPEMVNNCEHSNYVDNWCLGILCYEFCVGRPPFESKDSEETYQKIKTLKMRYPSCVPLGAVDLIKKLLVIQAHKRLQLKGVMVHPWITQHYQPREYGH
ncbi:aurora kinase C-like [Onthophagus taurus]|uniref:aurora kinase C-like n=1 Tax=Onthophagus taurus TaxID=166361 RepID=UPI000C20964D|nr:aurora kinase B-like [Onthophagus taurus]